MSRQYLKAKNRKRWILSAAMGVSALKGYQNMTKRDVAKMAGVANGLIHHYFGTMKGLRDEVMREAIRLRHVQVLSQGISTMDPMGIDAPVDLKEQAGKWVSS